MSLNDASMLNKINKSNVLEWQENKRKIKRDAGEEYVSKRRKRVPALTPPLENVICKCKAGCSASEIVGFKVDLFNEFRKKSYNEQSLYLAQLMEIFQPKRRRTKYGFPKRKCSVEYTLAIHDKNFRVCQRTIADTFKITPRRIQLLREKLIENSDIEDKRGKHNNRPRSLNEDLKSIIRHHIESFPRQESHYSRNKSSNEVLYDDLNINIMFKLFNEKYPQHKESISKKAYMNIFYSEYKLHFGLPRSDTCTECDKFYIDLKATSSEEEAEEIQILASLHHMKEQAGYKQLCKDTVLAQNSSNLVVLFTDLQQVLCCPNLQHSSMFYQRQLSCYNYCIHDAKTNDASMMYWDETVGRRGSIEITSALAKYIKENFQPLEEGIERKLIVWSDRCVSQNNNWKMLALFVTLIFSGYFTHIDQKFLSTGHSFLPCDRDFSLIEKNKKKAKVYLPFDWVTVLVNARPSKPFTVINMNSSDFVDFSAAENLIKSPNLKVKEYLWFQLTKDSPRTVSARKNHNIFQLWHYHNIFKNRSKYKKLIKLNDYNPIYGAQLPITKEKKKDLLDQCKYLPPETWEFYQNLTVVS